MITLHFWVQSVRNKRGSALSEQAICLKGLYLFNGWRWKLIPLLESLGDLLEQPTAMQWTIFHPTKKTIFGANVSERIDVMPCSPAFNMAVRMADWTYIVWMHELFSRQNAFRKDKYVLPEARLQREVLLYITYWIFIRTGNWIYYIDSAIALMLPVG